MRKVLSGLFIGVSFLMLLSLKTEKTDKEGFSLKYEKTDKEGFYKINIINSHKNNTIVAVKYYKKYDNGESGWHCFKRYLDKGERITFYTKNRIYYYQAHHKGYYFATSWDGDYTVTCDGSKIKNMIKVINPDTGEYYTMNHTLRR
jgi:hypothetical protein